MDCLEAIMTRRSVRHFQPDSPLGEGQIETLLRAGMAAPSARNLQPWELLTITRQATLTAVAEVLPNGAMLPSASLGIVVCGHMNRTLGEDKPLYWVIDCAAAGQNILLAAHAMGLGGVWLGVFPRVERMQGIAEIFRLPAVVVPHSVLALGVPAERGTARDKFDLSRVHREGWQGRAPTGRGGSPESK